MQCVARVRQWQLTYLLLTGISAVTDEVVTVSLESIQNYFTPRTKNVLPTFSAISDVRYWVNHVRRCSCLASYMQEKQTAYCTWYIRYEAALIAQGWILLLSIYNNRIVKMATGRGLRGRTYTAVLRRGFVMSANWSSGWLACNMGCSRQSLMKLARMNGVNVCELVFVSQMDVFSICSICPSFSCTTHYSRRLHWSILSSMNRHDRAHHSRTIACFNCFTFSNFLLY